MTDTPLYYELLTERGPNPPCCRTCWTPMADYVQARQGTALTDLMICPNSGDGRGKHGYFSASLRVTADGLVSR